MHQDTAASPKLEEYAQALALELNAIIRRYLEHLRERKRKARESGIGSSEPWVWTPATYGPLLSPEEYAIRELQLDPTRFALKAAAREIGWRAYVLGGVGLMQRVCKRVQVPGSSDVVGSAILDAWWDNIGRDLRDCWGT